jgi:hypothetical protein
VAIVVVEGSPAADMVNDHVLGLFRQLQDTLGLAAAVAVEDNLAVGTRCSLGVDLVVAGCTGLVVHLAMAGLVAYPFGGVEEIVGVGRGEHAQDVQARRLVCGAC